MSKDRTHGFSVARAIFIAPAIALAAALGLVPAVSLALGGGNSASPPQPVCSTSATIPLEPQPAVLKGAPYSGVGTTEVVTTLGDGNRITRTNTMKYFRDSEGRQRTEYQLGAIGPFVPEEAQSIVTIVDPIADRRYVLHPSLKRADVFKLAANGAEAGTRSAGNAILLGSVRGGTPGFGTGSAQGRVGLMPSEGGGRSPRLGLPSAGSRNGGTPTMAGPGIRGGSSLNAVEPMGGSPEAGASAAGAEPTFGTLLVQPEAGVPMCNAAAMKGAKPVSIGERNVEGLKVKGSRLEFTIPPGEVGNEQAITVRTDQWFSPDLGVVVSSTTRDPMIGDSTYRLEQIERVEPDESLFVIPPDYAKNPVGF
jgi:hypothetical protein